MEIKTATIENAKEVSRLLNEEFGKDYEPEHFTEEYVIDKINDEKNGFLIAIEDGKIIGVVRYSIIDIDLAELRTLSVSGEFKDKGIGVKLVETALEELKSRNVRKVVARTKTEKIPMHTMIEAGFLPEAYLKEHFRKGVDIIQWRKFL
ncbi:MAG: GNAT family N-acetyltransferase [Candidatus Aenigmarchaeota archaeon]|nr:GNAT family N-acetyltransferase [Candidatus Aenigmarchaeota archaeon]